MYNYMFGMCIVFIGIFPEQERIILPFFSPLKMWLGEKETLFEE